MNKSYNMNIDTGEKTWLTPPHIIEALGPFDLERDSFPHVRNIQPLDCDQLAELFEAIAKRIEELSPTVPFHSMEAAT